MVNELLGKVAIVTGGASGLGRGIAEKLSAEGARVVVADVDRDRGDALVGTLGADAVFQPTDVSQADQMTALVSLAIERFGGLDIMVNNAGVSSPLKRLLDDDFADFHRVMGINVLGVMLGTQLAARHMKTVGTGSIVNISSIGGILAGGGVHTYRASKAAVLQFTKSAAIELAHYDIRVNCIAPGNIPTTLLASSASQMSSEDAAEMEATVRARMRSNRPLQREGTADDVAEAVLYFAGERSRYVTGVVLPVDGGTVAGQVIARPAKRATEA